MKYIRATFNSIEANNIGHIDFNKLNWMSIDLFEYLIFFNQVYICL